MGIPLYTSEQEQREKQSVIFRKTFSPIKDTSELI